MRICLYIHLGPKPRLLLANRYYIRLVNMTTGSSAILFSNLTNAVAVDYDWKEQYVYWTDITSFNSSINRMPFNNTFHKVGKLAGLQYFIDTSLLDRI